MSAVALLDTNQQKISKKAAKQQAAKEKHQTNGTSAANGNNKEQQQSQPAILVLERSASSTSTPPPPSSSAMIAPTVRVKPVPAVAANQQRPSGRHQNPGATAAPPLPPTKRGAIAKPQPVPQSSVMDSTLELVLDTLPSAATAAVASVSSSAAIASNVGSAAPPERVEWVDLQRVDHGVAGRPMDVIVIGLSRGYQIWALLENGTCEEVVSERLGPLRIGLVLPSRVEPFQSDYRDTFADQRPLFALVDGTTRGANEREFCTAVMLSLKTGDIAHRLTFEEPVARIEASTKCLACSLTSRIVVVDAGTLTQRVSIFVEPGAFSTAAAALHDQWLAVGRQTLEARAQSCGGLGDDDRVASVASQMLSAFSSAVSHIGEHVVQLSRGGSPSGSTAAAMTETSASASLARQPVASLPSRGLVSVYDLNKVEQSDPSASLVAHWVAAAERIALISWSPTGRLVLTAGLSGTEFRVWALHAHASSSALAAAQHLYTLVRGTTPAKALKAAWSADERFVALASNHGTTHIFAVAPYGGVPSARTHAGHFVNRDSRFHRSAGLADATGTGPDVDALSESGHHRMQRGGSGGSNGSSGNGIGSLVSEDSLVPDSAVLPSLGTYSVSTPLVYKVHPSVGRHGVWLARAAADPRAVVPAIGQGGGATTRLEAVAKVRRARWSADSLTAIVADLSSSGKASSVSPTGVVGAGSPSSGGNAASAASAASPPSSSSLWEPQKVALAWASHPLASGHHHPTLLTLHTDGLLVEHQLRIGSEGTNGQLNVQVHPLAMWTLRRRPVAGGGGGGGHNSSASSGPVVDSLQPPLPADSPIITGRGGSSSSSLPSGMTKSFALAAGGKNDAKKRTTINNDAWRALVERDETYAPPSRRLHHGPQFTLLAYGSGATGRREGEAPASIRSVAAILVGGDDGNEGADFLATAADAGRPLIYPNSWTSESEPAWTSTQGAETNLDLASLADAMMDTAPSHQPDNKSEGDTFYDTRSSRLVDSTEELQFGTD